MKEKGNYPKKVLEIQHFLDIKELFPITQYTQNTCKLFINQI